MVSTIPSNKVIQETLEIVLNPMLKRYPALACKTLFRWGEKNTPLEHIKEPRQWQIDFLKQQEPYWAEYYDNGRLPERILKQSVVGGRGPGKSALIGMTAIMHLSMYLGSSTWVYANSEAQLRSKTFPEISKWLTCSILADWFDANSEAITPKKWFAEMVKDQLGIDPMYWYIRAQLWDERRPEAAAGAHNANGEYAIFDEASGIPDEIWRVVSGVFTEQIPNRMWLAMSNGTENSGYFYDTHHSLKDEWLTTELDVRNIPEVSKAMWSPIVDRYGLDHDYTRVHVLGKFALGGFNSFIPIELIRKSTSAELIKDDGAPLIMGVDVAFKRDKISIAYRQGNDARSRRIEVLDAQEIGLDTLSLYKLLIQRINQHKPDALVIDQNSVGVGVYDLLKNSKAKSIIFGCNFGTSAPDKYKDSYTNMKAYLWDKAKQWLEEGGCLENNDILLEDLKTTGYLLKGAGSKLMMETKEERASRGLRSTDAADAFVMTFMVNPLRRDLLSNKMAVKNNGVSYRGSSLISMQSRW